MISLYFLLKGNSWLNACRQKYELCNSNRRENAALGILKCHLINNLNFDIKL